ncbi:hypothetical protein PEDI_12310 [Persicobacter diffluens]|uniref:Uncharacterized protein n=1 Tax=Persicobacter diffluens TaxID=981 RepID=A0AAN4VWT7_9BACT|nr:hypothetical protein PEDI_12310 [Persicobacter diffluens]
MAVNKPFLFYKSKPNRSVTVRGGSFKKKQMTAGQWVTI